MRNGGGGKICGKNGGKLCGENGGKICGENGGKTILVRNGGKIQPPIYNVGAMSHISMKQFIFHHSQGDGGDHLISSLVTTTTTTSTCSELPHTPPGNGAFISSRSSSAGFMGSTRHCE